MDSYVEDDEERPANLNKISSLEEVEDFDDDDVDASDVASLKNLNIGPVKEISAPYDMPHYPIEVEEQRKTVHPLMEQFAHKEFEEREKALPTSKADIPHSADASVGEPSACNSGVASAHLPDTGNAGLTTPVTANKDSLINGGFDSGLRSPEVNEDIDYVPHFQRVYISGAENALSGVSFLPDNLCGRPDCPVKGFLNTRESVEESLLSQCLWRSKKDVLFTCCSSSLCICLFS